MSAPASPPNDLTRHQLDELDALLERMLSLPLSPAAPAAWKPAPAADPFPHVAGVPVEVPVPAYGPAAESLPPPVVEVEVADSVIPAAGRFGPVGLAPDTPGEPRTLRGVDAPATPAGFVSAFAPAEAAADPDAVELVHAPPPPVPAPVPFFWWPVAAVNAACESTLALLGPVGLGLLRPEIKHLAGAVGGLLTCGAAAWAVKGYLGR